MTAPPAERPDSGTASGFQQNVPLAVGCVVLTVFFFACLEASAKLATGYMPPLQVAWARYTVHAVLMVLFLGPVIGADLVRTKRMKLQVTRSVLLALTTMCQFTGLSYLQLAEVTVINFTAPFMVAVLAILFLGERPGIHRWAAIFMGFCGVLIVMRPGMGEVHWAFFVVLLGTVGMAFYLLITRMVSGADNAWASLFYTAAIGAVMLTCVLPFVWQAPTHWMGWLLMLGVGVFGAIGHLILIIGTRYAQGSLMAPFMYMQIVWSVLFGFVLFGDLPDSFTWAGATVVVLSGIYLAWREMRAARRAKQRA